MTGDENPNSVPFIAHFVVLMSPVCEPSIAAIMPIARRVEVLVAVRHDDVRAADDDAGVDGALGGDEAPDLLAGLRLDRVNARRRRCPR